MTSKPKKARKAPTPEQLEKIDRTQARIASSADAIAKFKARMAEVGIEVTDESVARLALHDPIDLTSRLVRDLKEEEEP